jgi:hypothetical protein
MEQQQRLLELTDQIIEAALIYVAKNGTFVDIEDMDGKGGTKTQRLSNVTGLGEIRLLRSAIRKEMGLDAQTGTGTSGPPNTGTLSLLNLIQSSHVNLEQLHNLGTQDE